MTPPTKVEAYVLGLLSGMVIGVFGMAFLASVTDERSKQNARMEMRK